MLVEAVERVGVSVICFSTVVSLGCLFVFFVDFLVYVFGNHSFCFVEFWATCLRAPGVFFGCFVFCGSLGYKHLFLF